MPTYLRNSLIVTSIFAAGSLLASCSSKDNEASKPAGATNAAATAPIQSPAMMAPAAYVPGPATGTTKTCNLEGFDTTPFRPTPTEAALSTTHSINGWIAAPQLNAPSFWLRLDDKDQAHYFQVKVTPSIKRADVAAIANTPALPENSGFLVGLPAHAVPAGSYHLYLVAQADGGSTICDDGRQVNFQ